MELEQDDIGRAVEDIAVGVIVREGRVLLGHRHPRRRWYPDCWDLIGGHVEPGEAARDALIRECAEELGIRVRALTPLAMPCPDPGIRMTTFLVTAWSGEPVNAAPDEHDELRWFAADDLTLLVMAHPAMAPALVETLDASVRGNLPLPADDGAAAHVL